MQNEIESHLHEIGNRKAVEEKLRAQIVDGEEKQRKNQSELEQALNQKIKELDGQNDQYLTQIGLLKSQNRDAVSQLESKEHELAQWLAKQAEWTASKALLD